jgi:hypothetical protein
MPGTSSQRRPGCAQTTATGRRLRRIRSTSRHAVRPVLPDDDGINIDR